MNGYLFTVLCLFIFHRVDSVIPSCPSSHCDGCIEEVVQGQPTCRIYENSASFSEIYEAEDITCLYPSTDNGFEVWGTGTHVVYSKTNYDESSLLNFGGTIAIHTATYEPPLTSHYKPVKATRKHILKYNEGDTVYELIHDSKVYIMMISKKDVQLSNFASTLNVPNGWTFQQRTLLSNLHVHTTSRSKVVLDDLDNIYTSLDECRFRHGEHHASLLNWVIGISFLIILCCAASFMCIRLYYLRRKRQRKRKLVKSGSKIKRYDSAASTSHSPTLPSSQPKTKAQRQEMC